MTLFESMQKKYESNPFLSLTDVIAQVLYDEIISFRTFPETKLVVSTLAQEFRASRTPVKAALTQLAEEGLVDATDKAFIVKPFSSEEYLDYYRFRTELEVTAARLAATQMTKQRFDKLSQYMQTLNNALEHHPDAAARMSIPEHEIAFHQYLVRCSNNPYLISAYNELIPRMRRYAIFSVYNDEYHKKYSQQHRFICQALCLGSPDAGEAAVRAHLEGQEMLYDNYLRVKNMLVQNANGPSVS